ncbi:hypothetical protein [Falsiroseomonas sp. CW058]|uniref:hypothetical protein n=1 Tax=Falsiroseomonas sp. CW058 TaxID=3388664 RepID=UPI003D316FD2
MELSPDQVRAAEAAGCAFIPATPEQVARLTMQRRIFLIDGQPHLARRHGAGIFETQGTLAPLIAAASAGVVPSMPETLQEAEEADASATLEIAAENRGAGGGGAKVVRRGRGRPPRVGRGA